MVQDDGPPLSGGICCSARTSATRVTSGTVGAEAAYARSGARKALRARRQRLTASR